MSKQQLKINNKFDRVVVLIDMDCFYCQVEEKVNPTLKGKPIAVVQYNAWKGGGIIAVNYPARDQGVTRHMRGDEAKAHCPSIELVSVPSIRGKADLSKYRDAGKEVASVLQTFTPLLERASVDEAYLDITEKVMVKLSEMNQGLYMLNPEKLENCYAVGYDSISDYVQDMSTRLKSNNSDESIDEQYVIQSKNDIKLLIGASIVNEIRADVKAKTGYECSAGIAHNKILAKLVCGINKPNKQTILPLRHLDKLYNTLSLKKIKGLGGKLGDDVCRILQVNLMSELATFSLEELQKQFDEKNGFWLHLISKGIDLEPVTPRFASKSIGCCKNFPGRAAIKDVATLTNWLTELAKEICERLEKDEVENNRKATQMVVGFMQEINNRDLSSSRSVPLHSIEVERMVNDALDVIRKNTKTFCQSNDPNVLCNLIKFVGLNVGKFEDLQNGKVNTIQNMFSNQTKKKDIEAERSVGKGRCSFVNMKMNDDEDEDVSLENCRTNEKKSVPKQVEIQVNKQHTIGEMFKNKVKKQIEDRQLEQSALNDENNSVDCYLNETISEESLEQNDIEKNDLKKSYFINKSSVVQSFNQENHEKSIANNKESKLEFVNIENDQLENVSTKNVLENDYEIGESSKNLIQSSTPIKDYTKTYAEYFQHPAQPVEIIYEKCSQCGKSIPNSEMLSHTDAHLAFQLSQEQRQEYRNSLIKSKPTPPVTKKQKIDMKTSAPKSKLLQQFLVKEMPVNQQVATENSTENCPDCGKLIEIRLMLEHMDYHLAKKLQFEVNGVQTRQKPNTRKKSKESSNVKSVASFFSQKN